MENKMTPEQQHSELSPDKVRYFREKLPDKEANLEESIRDRRKEALEDFNREGTGDTSGYPQHIADMGSDEFSREFDYILIQRHEQELEEVRQALKRIDEGAYGICQRSGKEINLKRLEAMPEARFSITHRETDELRTRPSAPLQG